MSAITFPGELPTSFRIAIRRHRVLHRLDRFVFVSLLSVITLVAIPYGTVEPWWISLYECTIFGLGALWICQETIAGWQLKQAHLLAPLAALTAFVFTQSIVLPGSGSISADPFETRLLSMKLLAFSINAALLIGYTSNHRRLRSLVHTVIAVAIASALFGIIRHATQQSETGFLLPYLQRKSGFGQFVNKNHFAFFIEMAIGLAAGLIFAGAVPRERWLIYLAAMVLLWCALVLTSSRGGLFAVSAEAVFVVVLLIWSRSKQRQANFPRRAAVRSLVAAFALSACLILSVIVSAVWLGGDLLVTRLASLPEEVQTVAREAHAGTRRREVWNATWQLIKTHPIVGSGFGAYGVAITKFHDASGKWTPEAAHNDYLELLGAGGVVGVGLVSWFSLVFIKCVRRELLSRDTFRRAACLGALTGIAGVVVHSTVDFGLHVTANAVILIALLVIATRNLEAKS